MFIYNTHQNIPPLPCSISLVTESSFCSECHLGCRCPYWVFCCSPWPTTRLGNSSRHSLSAKHRPMVEWDLVLSRWWSGTWCEIVPHTDWALLCSRLSCSEHCTSVCSPRGTAAEDTQVLLISTLQMLTPRPEHFPGDHTGAVSRGSGLQTDPIVSSTMLIVLCVRVLSQVG